jgi:hypothetical protein
MSEALLHELGRDKSKRSVAIATAICGLVVEGKKLGELESYEAVAFGERVVGQRMPREWLMRLEAAIKVGAFERLEVKDIVERILIPRES